jgi:hypothetical protein
MYLPAQRDDLSVLGNDIFSNLIRDSYRNKVSVTKKFERHRLDIGYSRINVNKAQDIARETMFGMSRNSVIGLFIKEGGSCEMLDSFPKKIMKCEVIRKWKLKNIGAPFDTSLWQDPAVKFSYLFLLSTTDNIIDTKLDLIDATQYKKHTIKK